MRIPGKLKASPVQHPATPAFITAGNIKIRKHKQKLFWKISPKQDDIYHHLFHAISLKSIQLNCALQIKLQRSAGNVTCKSLVSPNYSNINPTKIISSSQVGNNKYALNLGRRCSICKWTLKSLLFKQSRTWWEEGKKSLKGKCQLIYSNCKITIQDSIWFTKLWGNLSSFFQTN